MRPADPQRQVHPPRRFRRRLLGVMVAAGLVPVLLWAALNLFFWKQLLSISLGPIGEQLETIDRDWARAEHAPAQLREAAIHLTQADMARGELFRLMPYAVGATVLVLLAVLGVSAVFLSRSLSGPLEELTNGMLRVARGDLATRVPERGDVTDELPFLVVQFNRMTEELAAQKERLRVTEELAAWKDVARVLAHELRNPLTAMRMAVARLQRLDASEADDRAARTAESANLLQGEIERLLAMTQSFSTFAKLPTPVLATVELRPLVAEVCALYQSHPPVGVELVPGADAQVRADADQLRRAIGNLVKNGIEASTAGAAPVRVELATMDGRVEVSVLDAGQGIAEPLGPRELGRSLGSTKPGGSGLGLPIAHKIVHEHGGSLALLPRPEGGTRAVVYLPTELA